MAIPQTIDADIQAPAYTKNVIKNKLGLLLCAICQKCQKIKWPLFVQEILPIGIKNIIL